MPDHVPVFQEYMNPILSALRSLGGAATIEVLNAKVAEDMGLSPEVLAIPHKPERPDRSEVAYRAAWARTYLKAAGLVTNPSRGTWALTSEGAATERVDSYALASRVAARGEGVSSEEEAEAVAEVEGEASLAEQLAPELESDILSRFESLLSRGGVLRTDHAVGYYRRFRERFGPEVLAALDGERLLSTLHGRQTKDSLVYWLEFKDDEEFPARFGSIAGGSALKFGIYQSKEGDFWTGSSSRQQPLTLAEAIERARRQRDELVAGTQVLEAFGQSGSTDYLALQTQMTSAAPEVAETAWGHKYFSLLNPYLLDDYHALGFQKYHLVKLLQLPHEGRYANAGPFVRIARKLGLLPSQLATVLNDRNGSPHAYWRIGTTTGIGHESEWPRMRDGGFVAIGWTELGDLSDLVATRESKLTVRERMDARFPGPANVLTRKTQEVFNFVVNVRERDLVLAMAGKTVKGIGAVRGPYYYEPGSGPFGHRRRVEWLDVFDWVLPQLEGMQTTFVPLSKFGENLVAAERRLLRTVRQPTVPPPASSKAPAALSGISARVQAALHRKGQVILYGPPGTGKTYWAETTLRELIARSWYGKEWNELSSSERDRLERDRSMSFCTFHPAYGYEDFIEGYRPVGTEGSLGFRLQPGIFKDLCTRAGRDPGREYFLLIDEINRGDIPRIFGELLTLLEKDKRGRELILPLSRESFSVPENVRVIATMNTADRSIALLDAALRRRFAFVELMPEPEALAGGAVGGLPLGPWLRELNDRIVKHVGRDARNLQVGHAYLMQGSRPVTDPERFLEVFRDDLLPLLEEYCYEDSESLALILGGPLVVRDRPGAPPRVRDFREGSALVDALHKSFEGLATAPEALAADEQGPPDDAPETDGDEEAEQGKD